MADRRNTQPTRDRASRGIHPRREIDRFESLVGELSAAMTRASAHEVDREIEVWLGKISHALGLDRSGIMSVTRLPIRCAPRIPGSGLTFLHYLEISIRERF